MRPSVFVLLLVACGDPTVLDGKGYSVSCAVEADCVGVFLGDQCAPCGCANAAIATSDQVRYQADRTAARRACGPQVAIACAPCQDRRPACIELGNPLMQTLQFFCELR